MTALRELVQHNPGAWLAAGGFVIGALFGGLVFRTNFCTMGAISDFMNFGDYRRFRAWLLAAATALALTQWLDAAGVVPLGRSMYLSPQLNWFGNIAGGAMFGIGMVFAGGCASRNLTRAGAGDIRSLLVLIVMGLVAYMSISGILGPARSWIERTTSIDLAAFKLATQGLGEVLGALARIGPAAGNIVAAALCLVGIAFYCFKDTGFRSSRPHVLSGIGIGLCVAAGWALTGLAFDDLADKPTSPISLTFVRPTADSIDWLQRYTAGPMPGFGAATVFGVMFGAFVVAIAMGRFRWSTFSDVGDTTRCLFGAVLMGIGGVFALGCTVGQAITGVATLAAGSFLTFAAIVAGGMYGMKKLEQVLAGEA